MFVCPSVCSGNEYDVLLGNKHRAFMGIDTIADWKRVSSVKYLMRSFQDYPPLRQSGALMYFADSSLLMANQKVATTTLW